MATLLDVDTMEALITSRAVFCCDLGSSSDLTSSCTSSSTSETNRFRDSAYCSINSSPAISPIKTPRSALTSSVVQHCAATPRIRNHSGRNVLIMDDKDKGIYNSLGSSSSPSGKLTFSQLGLQREWRKRGVMFKTGPNPTWLTPWKKRVFVLKGNFLYYFAQLRDMKDAPCLGAIYLRNAIIKKDSMPLAKKVLKISPPVPRRMGWKGDNDESSVFHIKFKTESGRDEWYEELQQVSFENEFPAEKEPLIDSSMQFVSSYKHNNS